MSTPQWKTILESYEARIAEGDLAPGARIPAEEEIARHWQVSRQTVTKAVQELQRRGLVVRKRRWGTVVADPAEAQGTGRVAVLVDRYVPAHNFPHSDLLRGIEDALGEGYHLMVGECKSDPAVEARKLRELRDHADGAILYPTSDPRNNGLIQSLFDSGFPLVVLDRFPEGLRVDTVTSDNEASTARAVAALKDRGHERVGFLSFHKPDFSSVMERHRAYAEAMGEDVAEATRWLHRHLEDEPQLLVQAVQDALFALVRGPRPVTAVFCVEDLVAAAALQACERLGWSVPEDLEIAFFNDWPPMSHRAPWNLHRLVQRHREIGHRAATLLLDRARSARDARAAPRLARVPADLFSPDALPSVPDLALS